LRRARTGSGRHACLVGWGTEVWGGAAQCDTSKGSCMGEVTLTRRADCSVDVTFSLPDGQAAFEVQAYLGTTPAQRKSQGHGYDYTVAPAQLNYQSGQLGGNNGVASVTYTLTTNGGCADFNDGVYFIQHADACFVPPTGALFFFFFHDLSPCPPCTPRRDHSRAPVLRRWRQRPPSPGRGRVQAGVRPRGGRGARGVLPRHRQGGQQAGRLQPLGVVQRPVLRRRPGG